MRFRSIATLAMPTFLLAGMSACSGRTTDRVEPDGSTIEVVIDTVATDTAI